jgi:hypothetical protein
MKFGKTFDEALKANDIPEEWRSVAIKYKTLKANPISRFTFEDFVLIYMLAMYKKGSHSLDKGSSSNAAFKVVRELASIGLNAKSLGILVNSKVNRSKEKLIDPASNVRYSFDDTQLPTKFLCPIRWSEEC